MGRTEVRSDRLQPVPQARARSACRVVTRPHECGHYERCTRSQPGSVPRVNAKNRRESVPSTTGDWRPATFPSTGVDARRPNQTATQTQGAFMKRVTFFAYGVTCHLLFLATYAWLAGFVGNLFVPKSIDSGRAGAVGWAILVDLGLIALFAVQHSVMARPAFKRVWTRVVPPPIERSTYVLLSNVVLWILMWLWQPIDLVIWDAPAGIAQGVLL